MDVLLRPAFVDGLRAIGFASAPSAGSTGRASGTQQTLQIPEMNALFVMSAELSDESGYSLLRVKVCLYYAAS